MNDGAALLLLVVVGVFVLLAVAVARGGGSGRSGTEWQPGFGSDGAPDRPFKPTVSGPGIAIDDVHGWLWLATKENGCLLLDRAHVREWSHDWRSMPNGEKWHNEITVRTTDLNTPIVKVAFGRNFKLAETWQARLTTWLNG